MYNSIQLTVKYIQYYLTASSGKGHGIHSPFVFDFIQHVLNDKRLFSVYDIIEALRYDVLHDKANIEVRDYGAGSSVMPARSRRIKDIARWSLKSPKYAQLLFRMVNYYQSRTIVELGTSFGMTTAYLAAGNADARVFTFEGAETIAEIAKQHFKRLDLGNIHLTEGNFDRTLQPALQQIKSVDFAFVDGNHRKEPTLRYFNWLLPYIQPASVLVFDDIHWSREMEEAWQSIHQHSSVTCSIDLFFIGIIFFTPDIKTKQHFSIRF